jgi:adenosine/AMP kinase
MSTIVYVRMYETHRPIPVLADVKNMHIAMVAMISAAAPNPFEMPAIIWRRKGMRIFGRVDCL